jgi:hypothetical protein
VALAIAVVVGLVFWVGSCQGKDKHDEYASYMNSVRAIAQSSAATGTAAFATEVNSTTKLTLTALRAKLEQWSQQQQQSYDDAVRLRPPGPLQSAHQQVLAALQLRAIGLAGLADTIATAGSKSAFQVAELLAKQAEVLSASDLVWAQLFRLPATETLKRQGVQGVIAPPSQIVANPEVYSVRSFKEVYKALHATTAGGKVTGLHGTTLLGTEAVSTGQAKTLASGPTTVDVAADLVFKVSLKDAGNFREVQVPVTLTISVFNHQVFKKTQHVSVIQKGETRTVSFANLQLPNSVFSAQGILRVEVGKVPGETNLGDNTASYPVFFSLSTGG